MYLRNGIPWFKLYDDYVEGLSEASEALASVVSVSEIDKGKQKQKLVKVAASSSDTSSSTKGEGSGRLIDPDAPPTCFLHALLTSSCVFRPCGHTVCPQCLGVALLGKSGCPCGSKIAKVVGMKQPVHQMVSASESDEEDEDLWNFEETEELAVRARSSGKVTIIHLRKDDVAPLQKLE